MKKTQHFTGVDVGSQMVRVVVVQKDGGTDEIRIVGTGKSSMEGMQKGIITDVNEAVRAVSRALDLAERVAGMPLERAYVSINGAHITSQTSRGVIAVSRADGEITSDDISRVLNAAQAISLPANREILHVLPQTFIVDGQGNISDPIGMTGVRLEVEAHIVEGSSPFIKNLTKVLNQSGIHVDDFVFAPLASARAVLEKRQKDLGVILVDLGAGTTSLVVYEENRLLSTGVLPLGSSHITNDVAIGLRTSIEIAEAVKLEHGSALPEEVKSSETIVVESEGEEESFPRREVATIISARLEELFSFVDKELKRVNRSGLLPAGIVLTGAGAHLPGIIDLAKKKLRLPVRIGRPSALAGAVDEMNDPSASVVLGLVGYAYDEEIELHSRSRISMPQVGQSIQRVREWVRNFLP